MNAPKVLRWLRSRPLARVRRALAIRRRAGNTSLMSEEIKRFYTRELLDDARQEKRIMEWARRDFEDARKRGPR